MDYLARAAACSAPAPTPRWTTCWIKDGAIYRRLWQPLAIAALNTPLDQASAALLARVLSESFGAGGAACLPLVPKKGLSESLVDPALGIPQGARRGDPLQRQAARASRFKGGRAAALDFDSGETDVAGAGEALVLAVTAPVAARLLPEISAPDAYPRHRQRAFPHPRAGEFAVLRRHRRRHRRMGVPQARGPVGDGERGRPAGRHAARRNCAEMLWRDVAAAYELASGPVPPVQIVKERRATFAATPAQLALRPGSATRWDNLVLAGDWTDTGLPATIEGAIRSGFGAADTLLTAGAGASPKTLSGASRRSTLSPLARSAELRPSP